MTPENKYDTHEPGFESSKLSPEKTQGTSLVKHAQHRQLTRSKTDNGMIIDPGTFNQTVNDIEEELKIPFSSRDGSALNKTKHDRHTSFQSQKIVNDQR